MAVTPSYHGLLRLCLLHTVSCPVTSSELKSLDIRDLEVRIELLLFHIPLEWLGSPCLQPDFTLENTVQYLALIIYSS